MLSLACRDTGAKVIECDYVAKGTIRRRTLERWYRAYSKGPWNESWRILLHNLKTIINNTSNIPKID